MLFFPSPFCDVCGKICQTPPSGEICQNPQEFHTTLKSNHVGVRLFETNVIKRSTNKFDLTFLIKDWTC